MGKANSFTGKTNFEGANLIVTTELFPVDVAVIDFANLKVPLYDYHYDAVSNRLK